MRKGLFIVFEGIDGSGKTTQIELLKKFLASKVFDPEAQTRRGLVWEAVSFPQYGKNEYANKIYDYLSGKFGKLNEIDPYTIAKLYASDRKTAKEQILKWLEEGKLVIANRYVFSSYAHLGANLVEEKREEFSRWLDELEYNINKIPKEDLTILLDVNSKVGQGNVLRKHEGDLHEKNLKHLEQACKIYSQLAKKNPSWYVIDCMRGEEMKTKEEIHYEILKILERILNAN